MNGEPINITEEQLARLKALLPDACGEERVDRDKWKAAPA